MAQQVPDVRVRLSADGVDEVVRAFQQVSAAAKKSGKESSDGFSVFGLQLTKLSGLLPALGIAGSIAGLESMVKSALSAASAVGSLNQKTGLSVERLSVIRVAANQAGLEIEDLSKGLTKFNKTMASLDEGSSQAAAAVRRLFGSSQALNGLNTDQRFEKVTKAIANMKAGYEKTKAAQDFFGKSGAEQIPLINKLGKNYDELHDKAQKMGLVFNQDAIDGAKKFKKSLNELKEVGEGLATQFALGLAPALGNAAKTFTESVTGSGVDGLKKVGEIAGTIVKGLVLVVETVGALVGNIVALDEEIVNTLLDIAKTFVDSFKTIAKGAGDSFTAILHGNAAGVMDAVRNTGTGLAQIGNTAINNVKDHATRAGAIVQSFIGQVKGDYNKLFGEESKKREADTGDTSGGKVPMVETAKAMAEFRKAQIENELALNKKRLDLVSAAEQRAYDQGLTSLKDYYDQRAQVIQEGSDKEIAALKAQRSILANSSLGVTPGDSDDQIAAKQIKRKQELAALDNKIALAQLDTQGKLAANSEDERKAQEAYDQKRLDVERQIQEAQGQTYEAALTAIDRQVKELEKAHLPPELIAQLRKVLEGKAALADVQRQGQQAVNALNIYQAGLQNKVNAGQLFPFEAVQQYDAAVQDALPHLRDLAEAQKAAAVTPEEVQAAEQFSNEVEALGAATDKTARDLAFFKQNLESALTNDLTNFLTNGIDQAESFSDAMRMMALSVVDSLRQIAAQMLANLLIQKLLSASKGFFGFSQGGPVGTGHADGGLISGPGTATSDSIPARLSNGEFVVRAGAVAQPGVLPLLTAINRGMGTPSLRSAGVPRFATGGFVSAADALAASANGGGGSTSIHLGIEEGIFVKRVLSAMSSKDGQRVQIENLNKNQKSVTRAIGK